MIDDLDELKTFVRIVAAGSLSAAARELGVGLGVVSKRLATLERRVGVRLINRTTRHLSCTDEGRELYARAERLLADLSDAEAMLTRGRGSPSGLLRISATATLGRAHVGPVCADLVATHPALSIDLLLTDRLVHLVDEAVDVAIRIGEPKDSSMAMRKLADNHRIIVAAPSYLSRRGTPTTLEDLAEHECLRYGAMTASWRLIGPTGESEEIAMGSRLHSNNGDTAHAWAVAGAGLLFKSWIDVADDLAQGRLVHVLKPWRSAPAPVCALFPSGRHPSPKVRLFLEAMTNRMASMRG